MTWREHRRLELALSPEALLAGFKPEELTLFVEGSGQASAGERLALLITSPPLPHRALVRGIVAAVRRSNGKGLPPGFQAKIHPRDGGRLKRLVAAAQQGSTAPFPARRHERIAGVLPVKFAVGFAKAEARLTDASVGGAALEIAPGAFAPKEGAVVELLVELPGILGRKILLVGRVAWSDPDRGFGLEFGDGMEPMAKKLVRAIAVARKDP